MGLTCVSGKPQVFCPSCRDGNTPTAASATTSGSGIPGSHCRDPATAALLSPPDHALAPHDHDYSFVGRDHVIRRNITTSMKSVRSQAPVRMTTKWRQSMTKSRLFALTAVLSVAIATPVLAAGETANKPWSAPVGHRQPRAVDIPPSLSPQTLDQEDIYVDRKISGICRGC
jgi:hypothetical protein